MRQDFLLARPALGAAWLIERTNTRTPDDRTAISELSDENDSVRAAWREQLPCKDTRHALARSAGVRTQVRLRDEHNVAKGLHEHQVCGEP